MPISAFDVTNIRNSLEGLGDSVRQSRLDKEKREDEMRRELIQRQLANAAESRQERGLTIEEKRLEAERGRGDELKKQGEYNRDPENPENQERTARAKMLEAQAEKLGIREITVAWTDATGNPVQMVGTPQEIAVAQKANPPAPQSKITSKFTTKDGVEHTITGTPEQLKAQQAALGEQGGGIQPPMEDVTTKTEPGALPGMPSKTTTTTKGKQPAGEPAAPPTATAVSEYENEAAARAAGKGAGDIVTLKGVGKVRLK